MGQYPKEKQFAVFVRLQKCAIKFANKRIIFNLKIREKKSRAIHIVHLNFNFEIILCHFASLTPFVFFLEFKFDYCI